MRLLLVIAAAAISIAQSANQNGSLSGTVIDSITHQPVKKAIVSTQPMQAFMNGGVTARTSVTDLQGSFTLDDLPPGEHAIFVTHPSYAFGQPLVKNVQIASGEKAGPLTIELTPGAAISGRILDEDGDPLLGCFVQVHGSNPREGVGVAGSLNSNEQGEYRVHDIKPGKYRISAHCQQPLFQPRPFSSGPDPPPSLAYPDEYYPLAPDEKSAETITLTAGAEKTGVDFRMRPSSVTYIRVAFTGVEVGERNDLMLVLAPADPQWRPFGAVWRPANIANGIGTVNAVFPGSYRLVALRNKGPTDRLGGIQRIEVKDRPLDVTMELRRGAEIKGAVTIEGNSQNIALNAIQIVLADQDSGIGVEPAQLKDDHSFVFKSVLPGQYSLLANGSGIFLKSAWMGSMDITHKPVDLTSGLLGDFRIVLSTNTATLHVTAPPRSMVCTQFLEDNVFRPQGCEGIQANGEGTFTGLAPGKYRVVGTTPGFAMPEEGGQEVTLHEGETVNIQLGDQKP